MCDTVPGALLLVYHHKDPAARQVLSDIFEERIEGVGHDRDLQSMLSSRHASGTESLPFRIHRLRVPEGQEIWKLNAVLHDYGRAQVSFATGGSGQGGYDEFLDWAQGTQNPFPLLVGQEHYLHLAGATLSPHHATYQSLLNLPPSGGETGGGTTISIIDSGLEPGGVAPGATYNWVDDTAPRDATDRIGHGTGVATVIADLAPGATLEIHKVSDRPRISEWAVLAALAASSHADVVNMSLAFGLETRDCRTCGRQSHGARSQVFEVCLDAVLDRNDRQIVVAAAGNQSADKLDYPARFGQVLAVCASAASGGPAGYTNHGASNHCGDRHDGVFLAPGGDGPDHVVSTDTGGNVTEHTGTSFAAPYVSAMIALRRSGPGTGETRDQTLRYFGTTAETSVPGFSASKHGNGLIQY